MAVGGNAEDEAGATAEAGTGDAASSSSSSSAAAEITDADDGAGEAAEEAPAHAPAPAGAAEAEAAVTASDVEASPVRPRLLSAVLASPGKATGGFAPDDLDCAFDRQGGRVAEAGLTAPGPSGP